MSIATQELVVGSLYQVFYEVKGYTFSKSWVLAEYMSTVEAHDYKYSNLSLGGKDGFRIGPERTGHAAKTWYFKTAWNGSRFGVTDPKHIREASPEAITEVNLYREKIKEAETALLEAKRNLKDFCV